MKKEIQIGILALVVLVSSILGYRYIKGTSLFSSDKTYKAYFDEVNELEVASPVKINGFKVGSVISMEMDYSDVNKILVNFSVNSAIDLPKSSMANLLSAGPLGGREISISFKDKCSGNDCLEDGALVNSSTLSLIESMISDDDIDKYIGKLETSADSIIAKVSGDDADNSVARTMNNMEVLTLKLNDLTNSINKLLQNSSKNLEQTFGNLNKISSKIANNEAQIDAAMSNLSNFTKQLNELPLKSTMSSANGALDETKLAIKEMKSLLENTQGTLSSLNGMMTKMNEGDGTMANLINDKDLYENLERSTKNLDLLLQDFRLNPKRYIDLRIIGKKQKQYKLPEDDPAFQN